MSNSKGTKTSATASREFNYPIGGANLLYLKQSIEERRDFTPKPAPEPWDWKESLESPDYQPGVRKNKK